MVHDGRIKGREINEMKSRNKNLKELKGGTKMMQRQTEKVFKERREAKSDKADGAF